MSTSTTAAEKVAYEKVVRATIRVNNSVDASKVYDIEADAEVNNGVVNNINSGTVKKDGSQVATFNSYGNENLSINHNVGERQEQCEITAAVNTFITDTKAKVATAQSVSLP
jgi:hypothetical protein|uniref:Uncharacterized protein n=1 Tax=Myoviridae sp. ct9Ns12 TaxID=2826626 RepID=A0A8S5MH73_9CAUD|nr:MAG TPA: hypothetical protein [Myoviridae sp. ct9Ns12]